MDGVIQEIKQEHAQVRSLLRLFLASQDLGSAQAVCWQVVGLCCVHGYKEQESLYPALERVLGQDHTTPLLLQHKQVLEKLAAVDSLRWQDIQADPQGWRGLVQEAVQLFLDHAVEEEEKELVLLDKLGSTGREELQRAWRVAALHAPTRPHPESPMRPYDTVVAAHLAEAPLDRAADHFRATVIVPHNRVMEERRGVLGFSSNTPMPTTGSIKALKAAGGHVALPKPPTHTSTAKHGVRAHARPGSESSHDADVEAGDKGDGKSEESDLDAMLAEAPGIDSAGAGKRWKDEGGALGRGVGFAAAPAGDMDLMST